MNYETPELTALTSAISAIQAVGGKVGHDTDSPDDKDLISAYQDWE
jgi:hypothetical protein